MTQAQLLAQIGFRIRTASRNFITDSEISTELNRSIDRLTDKIDLETAVTTTTIAFTGDGTYSLPADFKKPISLYDRTNKLKYKLVSKSELYEAENDGQNLYTIRGSNVDIESTSSSATLTLTYYSTYDCQTSGGTWQKGLSSSTDVPLLQTYFHDFFVEDVAAILFRKERKYDDYKIARGESKEILSEIEIENPSMEETVVTIVQPPNEDWD